MIKVGIIGISGYTGLELLNILSCHDGASVTYVANRSNVGQSISSLYPTLTSNLVIEEISAKQASSKCDVVFTALPHAASAEIVGQLYQEGIRVVDLSADFRYNSLDLYQDTYKVTHPYPDLLKQAVYGLPELNRNKIRTAAIVGNPGCYTTSAILPLLPLLRAGLISPSVIVDSASGASGAGKKSDVDFSFTELFSNFKAYGVTTHRHTSEIEEVLSLNSNQTVLVDFTPHLLPVKRGILSTIYADLKHSLSLEDIINAYSCYKNEPFINVTDSLPEIKNIVHSNRVQIGFKINPRTNRLIIISALDNLFKGASGQAIQNMNIMFGINETMGLTSPAKPI